MTSNQNCFIISKVTKVYSDDRADDVLNNAVKILQRDIAKVVTGVGEENEIIIRKVRSKELAGDQYELAYLSPQQVVVEATTSLGAMYGVLAISRQVLGIDDFWYFMDTPVIQKDSIEWTNFSMRLPIYQVKYRGWFVNDELLLMDWKDHGSNDYVWERVYETLLRLGGNLIIPGTDTNSHVHRTGAQEMGLMIAHHHAEPLGAAMFARIYPDLEASYLRYPELFKSLWQKSIDTQKGTKVLFNLGFRGQGDRPFWEDDHSREWTDPDKAAVINEVIETQYQMVHQADPQAVCSLNIYGELTALFNQGLLKIPEDVVQIWADNGYGRMVSRRQGNDNPRSTVLRTANSEKSLRGIYYHIAFHDLQASSFLTKLANSPGFVSRELMAVRKVDMDHLVLINTGNIKPHVLFLREAAAFWRRDYQYRNDETIISDYVERYYCHDLEDIKQLYHRFFTSMVQYGPHHDEKAGDEFSCYLIRRIIKNWFTGAKKAPELLWLTKTEKVELQLPLILDLVKPYQQVLTDLEYDATRVYKKLPKDDQVTFYNDLLLDIVLYTQSLKALVSIIESRFEQLSNQTVQAFLSAEKALTSLDNILSSRKNNPSDKWRDFYQNDAYTNVALTLEQVKTLVSYLRIIGDGPNEDKWERQYLMEPGSARVLLLSNIHQALSDDLIAAKLRESFQESHFKA